MNEPQKARAVTELKMPTRCGGTAYALIEGVWHYLDVTQAVAHAFESGEGEPWPGEEIDIDEEASDRALDRAAKEEEGGA